MMKIKCTILPGWEERESYSKHLDSY